MAHVLVPFADPRTGERAVRALVKERGRGTLSVELVAVVEPLTPGKVGIFLSDARAEAMATAAGSRWLAPLEALLAQARIPYRSTVALGRLAEVVRSLAGRPGVDRVVLGSRSGLALPSGTRAALSSAPAVTVY